MNVNKSKKKYIVIQLGPRMHYAVPAFLAEAKYLSYFYTDIHSNHFFFRLIKSLLPKKLQFKSLKNLLARKLPIELNKENVKDQIFSSLILFRSKDVNKRAKILFDRVIKENFSGA